MTSSACAGRGRRSPRWSSGPACCRTCRRSSTGTVLLGRPAALPLVFGPTGFTRMMHTEGEAAVAARGCAHGDPVRTLDHGHDVDRAPGRGGAGLPPVVPALPVAGPRGQSRLRRQGPGSRVRRARPHRRHAGGRSAPPGRAERADPAAVLSLGTVAEGALHPSWWFDLLTTEPLEFASLNRFDGTVAELAAACRPGRDRLRPGLAARGMAGTVGGQGDTDGRRCPPGRRRSADAVVVSNHGGRQLDRAPTPLECLPAVVDARR